MNVGFIGAGIIANKMAQTINCIDGINNYAIASRDINKALSYKDKYGFEKAYGSYDELLNDKNVDLVYIATVHSTHYDIMLQCLNYNKPVLCEKSLTTSLKDTKDIYKKFENANLFLSEALWTAFLPSHNLILDLLYKQKVIGDIVSMESHFCKNIINVERINRKDLGGGAVLDMGIYPVSFTLNTLGFDYEDFSVKHIEFTKDNVDLNETIEFSYKNGVKALCFSNCISDETSSKVEIVGSNGKMLIETVNCPNFIKIFDNNATLIKDINCSPKYGGFEYEIIACKNALKSGNIQCDEWSHKNSIAFSSIADIILNIND